MFLIIQQNMVLLECETRQEAEKEVHNFECFDKEASFYEPNRYKIVEVK